jgi:hypothetical protein
MHNRPLSPRSTLVVLLGASEWPKWPDLTQDLLERDEGRAETFSASAAALREFFLGADGFGLPESNLLDLFNSEQEAAVQVGCMGAFLAERGAAIQEAGGDPAYLIVHYIGHGGFVGNDYYLVVRTSEKGNRIATSLRPESLVESVKENARRLRCLLVLDCCYAGAVARAFDEAAIRGISLLCSSAAGETSRANGSGEYTQFSESLIPLLHEGDREGPELFTLRSLRDSLERALHSRHGERAVRPVVLSPVQRDGDLADLPFLANAARRPRKGREWFVAREDVVQCYVVESATEGRTKPALRPTVRNALIKYRNRLTPLLGREIDTTPVAVNVDRIIGSQDGLENAIHALCQAEIAVFDLTNYEPAVMLLLGIRAVARRGVTVASAGGDYVVGDPFDYPFSIKEVNVLSHSQKQVKVDDPIDLIGTTIAAGFEQMRQLPGYLDLPVFDAIRTLPPGRDHRTPRDYRETVLVLCPFSPAFTENNWELYLKRQLAVHLPQTRIVRTLDMKSPRLVSQSLYEAIRLTQMCLVDWTEWRPNVFFELGVRLASVDIDPVCIIDIQHSRMIRELREVEAPEHRVARVRACLGINVEAGDDGAAQAYSQEEIERLTRIDYQARMLLEWLDPIEYTAPKHGSIEDEDMAACERMVKRHEQLVKGGSVGAGFRGLPPGFTYRTVSDRIDTSMEAGAFPVHDELIRAADLQNDPQIDSVGRSPVLYPKNEALVGRANQGALERRLAAWYYMENRLKEELTTDTSLQKKFLDLGHVLARTLLRSPREQDRQMARLVRDRVKGLEHHLEQEEGHEDLGG